MLAKTLIVTGLVILSIGIIVFFFGDRLHWIGRLPGDIHIEKEGFRLYIPITTMLLASLLLNLVIRLAQRWF